MSSQNTEYAKVSAQYEEAQRFFEAEQWYEALAAFEGVESQAPGFKDTTRYLEQARYQTRLLELYERAHRALDLDEYQGALNALNILTDLSPSYDVADLRQQAYQGLAQQEKRPLNEQYQQAMQQFRRGEYQACLDTLAVIREQAPDYPDHEGVEAAARAYAERQWHLRELYSQGVDQMSREEWYEATVTFEELKRQAPHYEDVEDRLATVRHRDRLSSLWQEAIHFLDQEEFAACAERLDELEQMDAGYRQDEVANLRQETLGRLSEQADRFLQQEKFEDSLAALSKLKKYAPNYAGLESMRAQALERMRVRNLQEQLDKLYQQAVDRLEQQDFEETLRLWKVIQQQKGNLDYPDRSDVEKRAKEGVCANFYAEALNALTQRDPHQAMDRWRKVREVDPDYPDSQGVEEHAQAMIARREKIRWWGLRLGGVAAVLVLVVFAFMIVRGCMSRRPQVVAGASPTPSPTPTTPVPSDTPTSTPTRTPSPTSTRTPSPTPSATPSRTPSPAPTTATLSPSPSSTPEGIPPATAQQPSGIFAAPDSASTGLGAVQAGEQVTVLGRASSGSWFYIRTDRGVEGFAYAPRFEWSGDFESLPVKTPSLVSYPTKTPVPTPTPKPGGFPPLEMDLWPLPWNVRCADDKWHMGVYIKGYGGDGTYTYYWEGLQVGGPMAGEHIFEVSATGGSVIGTGRVVSGDGQQVERPILIEAPKSCH